MQLQEIRLSNNYENNNNNDSGIRYCEKWSRYFLFLLSENTEFMVCYHGYLRATFI